MNTAHNKGEGCIAIRYSKSKYMSVINDYNVISFNASNSDAACISRIIEIFTLNKIRIEGQKLALITGVVIPDTGATADEVNLLLSRCASLCSNEEKEMALRQIAVNDAKVAIQQASGESRTISEVKSRKSSRMDREEAERRFHNANSRLAEQVERVAIVKTIPGLLFDEAAYIGKGINLSKLNNFKKASFVSSEIINMLSTLEGGYAIRFIHDSLAELTTAIKNILKQCIPPTDRYELDNGGVLKSQAFVEYYHVDNGLLRAMISAEEYVSYIFSRTKISETKRKIFSN